MNPMIGVPKAEKKPAIYLLDNAATKRDALETWERKVCSVYAIMRSENTPEPELAAVRDLIENQGAFSLQYPVRINGAAKYTQKNVAVHFIERFAAMYAGGTDVSEREIRRSCRAWKNHIMLENAVEALHGLQDWRAGADHVSMMLLSGDGTSARGPAGVSMMAYNDGNTDRFTLSGMGWWTPTNALSLGEATLEIVRAMEEAEETGHVARRNGR